MTIMEMLLSTSPIVVCDTEFTSWPGALERNWSGPGEHREIVQIGAVLLDAKREEAGMFSQTVRPQLNPVLSDYFISLTGITNDDLEAHGQSLLDALQQFAQFCSEATFACSFGIDHEIIQENCDLIGIENPLASVKFANIKQCLCDLAKIRNPSEVYSSTLPVVFGIEPQAHAHSGLSDARALASVLRHLKAKYPKPVILCCR